MLKYTKVAMESLQEEAVLVFGCGGIGKKLTKVLRERAVKIQNYIDNDESKWNTLFEGNEIIAPAMAQKEFEGSTVIIAIGAYKEVQEQLLSMNCFKVLVWFRNNFYKCEYICPLGCADERELRKLLDNKKISICGTEKHREDFLYIFDWLNIMNEYSNVEAIPVCGENDLMIICNEPGDEIENKLIQKGYREDVSMVNGESLFCLLDYIDGLNYLRINPSLMMLQTWHDKMKNQRKCRKAFEVIWISERYNVHCCCPDWSVAWGNLEYDTLDDIWNSTIAKIFRLSLINRTYSFCNEDRCVLLKKDVLECEERLEPVPKVPNVPYHLEIGIDKTCNLFCRSCRNCVYIEKDYEKVRSIEKKILKSGWLDSVDSLLLGGQGEVFFSEVYKEIMFGSNIKRNALELRTNGTLVTQKDLDELIARYKRLDIIVSIDAATKETYEYLRRSNNPNAWQMLHNNLKLLSEYRLQGKIDFFQVNMCVQMKNYKEISDFVDMGLSYNVDRVYITPIRNWGTYTEEEFNMVGIFSSGKTLKEEVQKAIPAEVFANKKVLFAF